MNCDNDDRDHGQYGAILVIYDYIIIAAVCVDDASFLSLLKKIKMFRISDLCMFGWELSFTEMLNRISNYV